MRLSSAKKSSPTAHESEGKLAASAERKHRIKSKAGQYGAQNEAYKMMEGWKVGKVVSLQRVMRGLMVEATQNETFTLV